MCVSSFISHNGNEQDVMVNDAENEKATDTAIQDALEFHKQTKLMHEIPQCFG